MKAADAADIRAFLAHLHRLGAHIRLRLVDEQRNIPGRALVEALAVNCSADEQPAFWTPAECADVLQLLCSLSARPGECHCSDDSAMFGYALVMDHLHDSIRTVSALLAAQDESSPRLRPYLVIDNTRGSTGDGDSSVDPNGHS